MVRVGRRDLLYGGKDPVYLSLPIQTAARNGILAPPRHARSLGICSLPPHRRSVVDESVGEEWETVGLAGAYSSFILLSPSLLAPPHLSH